MTEQSLAQLLEAAPRSLVIADIGAAYLGETPPYQPLMDLDLVARLIAIDADPRQTERLQAKWGEVAEVIACVVADGRNHTLHSRATGSNPCKARPSWGGQSSSSRMSPSSSWTLHKHSHTPALR